MQCSRALCIIEEKRSQKSRYGFPTVPTESGARSPLTSPTRGTKLQASPCSLSASTRGSDYPAFQPGTAGKPRTIFEAFFSVAHKEGGATSGFERCFEVVPKEERN